MSDALTVDNSERLEAIATEIETIQGVALLKIGERLHEARELFKYDRDEGGFTGWIDRRLKMGSTTAYNLIDVFKAFGAESFRAAETLPRKVLYALAAPSTPEPVREEAMRLADAGEPVDMEVVAKLKRELVDAKQSAKDAKRDEKVQKEVARKANDDRQKMLRDLEWAQSQLQAQAQEIERLKQDGVIHVYPSEPQPKPSLVAPAAPTERSDCLQTMAEIISDRFHGDTAELVALAREDGMFAFAEALERASAPSRETEAA